MTDLKWGKMHSNECYRTLHRADVVVGWVVMINDAWIARSADGSIRAAFDTMDEAQQFLTVMVSAGESDESDM